MSNLVSDLMSDMTDDAARETARGTVPDRGKTVDLSTIKPCFPVENRVRSDTTVPWAGQPLEKEGVRGGIVETSVPTRPPGFPAPSFERLEAAHRGALYAHAMRLVHRHDLAEDLVQDALTRAWRSFDRFDGTNFRAWSFTILTRLYLNARKKAEGCPEFDPDGPENAPATDPTPFQAATLDDLPEEIRKAVGELPPRMGRVFMLVEAAGLSQGEVAAAEGIPVGTVRSRLFRARAHLRERLADYARDVHGVG